MAADRITGAFLRSLRLTARRSGSVGTAQQQEETFRPIRTGLSCWSQEAAAPRHLRGRRGDVLSGRGHLKQLKSILKRRMRFLNSLP
jgi:hypothetical protein